MQRERERESERAHERASVEWQDYDARKWGGAGRHVEGRQNASEGVGIDSPGALVLHGGSTGREREGRGVGPPLLKGLSAVVAGRLHQLRKRLVKTAAAALPDAESP